MKLFTVRKFRVLKAANVSGERSTVGAVALLSCVSRHKCRENCQECRENLMQITKKNFHIQSMQRRKRSKVIVTELDANNTSREE